jgi:hypothetical protein
MEAPEVPLEQAQEQIHHHAQHHGDSDAPTSRWILGVALSSALLAALAAVASLLAGHHVNEAMISQINAANKWAYYQAKGIKGAVLQSKVEMLEALGKERNEKDVANVERYRREQDEIAEKAKESEHESEHHLQSHVTLARAVTMFQVSIAVAAISVLTRRRLFWFVSMAFGVVGIVFMIQQLLGLGAAPHH